MVAAVLTVVFISGKDVSAVEFYGCPGNPVICEQSNDSGYGDVEIDRCDPVVSVRCEFTAELAQFAPVLEIVIEVFALFERDNLCDVLKEQREGTPGTYDTQCHIVLIQHEHVAI